MFNFNKLFILSLLLGSVIGIKAGEIGVPGKDVWQMFRRQSLFGKLRLAAALVTLDHSFLPADLDPQDQNSRSSSVTLEEPVSPTSPTFLSHYSVVSPDPAISLPVVVAAPEPVVVPVRSFRSLLPQKSPTREVREKAAMALLIATYRKDRANYKPCFRPHA